MSWDLKSNQPIYTQLLEMIQLKIISGFYSAGGKLPSVRELASEAAVNPNTMQKALSELERSGLIYSQRTAGRFITEDADMIHKLREQIAAEQISVFFKRMEELGFSKKETVSLILNEKKGEEE